MTEPIDILIVGAGPAGTAAAITASRRGLSVRVIDKARFPRDKCCGDGLTTGALRRLEDLGVSPDRIPSWQPVDKIALSSPSGREFRFPLDGVGQFAAVARRQELDAALVDQARSVGVTIDEGHALQALRTTATGVAADVSIEGQSDIVSVEARYLVAADGMWSPTRKLLGLSDGTYRGEWHAFRQYFTGVTGRAATDLLVWFEPDLLPGYAWSFPVAGGAANVGFGIFRRPGQSVQVMKSLWADLLARPQVVEALGPQAEAEAPHRAWPIPARLGGLPVAQGPVLFVGDAAAAADPMTGEGIGQALETGQDAVTAIADHLDDPILVGKSYRSGLDRGMIRDHRLAGALSGVLGNRRGAEWSIRIAASNDWTRRNFARWLFEDYPRAALATPHRWHRRLFTSPGAYTNS
jgi:geranylgeranyl reductase family protein